MAPTRDLDDVPHTSTSTARQTACRRDWRSTPRTLRQLRCSHGSAPRPRSATYRSRSGHRGRRAPDLSVPARLSGRGRLRRGRLAAMSVKLPETAVAHLPADLPDDVVVLDVRESDEWRRATSTEHCTCRWARCRRGSARCPPTDRCWSSARWQVRPGHGVPPDAGRRCGQPGRWDGRLAGGGSAHGGRVAVGAARAVSGSPHAGSTGGDPDRHDAPGTDDPPIGPLALVRLISER